MKEYTDKHYRKKGRLLAAALALMLISTGCATAAARTGSAGTGNDNSVTAEASQQTQEQTSSAASKAELFTDRDLSGDYDESDAVLIALNGNSAASTASTGVNINGSTITITQDGTYIVSGSLTDGMIIVDADDSAKVQIVLKDASITSQTSAALYVKSADKVFVTTAAGTQNTLANGGTFRAIDDSNIDGAVFAKNDITFNGSGSLTVTSPAGHGIAGKDDVKFAGGTITINAADHGVQANDSVRIAEVDVTIKAGSKDGVHVSDNADEETGTVSDSYFYMADGTLTISAGDDGIHADAEALIEGGTINITKSYEGIEALTIKISGGDINVAANDDGLNAAGGNTKGENTYGDDDWFGGHGGFNDGGTDGSIVISGGDLHIKAGGDAVDSNGSVEISGGNTVVTGPSYGDTSVLDFNSTGVITGGTFIGTGGAGMAQNFSSVSNQGLIAVSVGNQYAGSIVKLTDANGNVIAELTPDLDYSVVYISTPDIAVGNTYMLTAGSYSETIELNDAIYSSISGGMHSGLGGMGPRPGVNGQNGSGDSSHNGMQGQDGHRHMHGGQGSNGQPDDITGATQMPDSNDNAGNAITGDGTQV